MSLNIFWFLPTHGDGHYLGTAEGARAVDHGYLQQVAQAADRLFPHLDIERPELPKSAGYVSPFGEMVANDIPPKAASQS